MIILKKEDFGANILIQVIGENKTEIEREYFGWVNHGCRSEELNWVKEDGIYPFIATFWCGADKINEILEERELFGILHKMDTKYHRLNGKTDCVTEIIPRFIDLAKDKAKSKLENIESVRGILKFKYSADTFNVSIRQNLVNA